MEHIKTGFELAIGACVGMLLFEWTRRIVKACYLGTLRFLAWVSTWGNSPQFMNRRGK